MILVAMVYKGLVYDPTKDLYPVAQYGSVDLNHAFRVGGISSSVTADQGDYNGIDSSESIVGKPRDVFESMRLHEFVQSQAAAVSDGDTDPSASGQTPGATS